MASEYLFPKKIQNTPFPSKSKIIRLISVYQALNPLLPIVLALYILHSHCCCLLSFLFTHFYFRFFFSNAFVVRTFITPTRQKLLEIQFVAKLENASGSGSLYSARKSKVTSAVGGWGFRQSFPFPHFAANVYP